jgi:hypothetical protein
MQHASQTTPTGSLGLAVTRQLGTLAARPTPALWWRIKNAILNRWRELPALAVYRLFGRIFSLVYIESALYLRVLHADGRVTDLGCVGRRVVTDVGVAFIVDAFQNSVELENMKYHGFGTGTTNEAAAQTALITELTTEYASDNTRPTGTTTEGATANIYRTVATLSPDSGGTLAITEHGIFSQAANSGGVLLDRTKFSAVNLVAGSDSLQATYELTFTSGS